MTLSNNPLTDLHLTKMNLISLMSMRLNHRIKEKTNQTYLEWAWMNT